MLVMAISDTQKYYYGKFNAYQRTYVLMGFKADAQFIKMGIDTYLPQKISEETQGGAMPYIKLSTLTSLKIPFTSEEKQLSIRKHYDAIAQKVEKRNKIIRPFIATEILFFLTLCSYKHSVKKELLLFKQYFKSVFFKLNFLR
ncbi:MAG: hypothetical protein L6V79_02880 [Clostridium sp.]|nr:MAG: hypothetical protein L6V79_02880 [Clostridium sp.]